MYRGKVEKVVNRLTVESLDGPDHQLLHGVPVPRLLCSVVAQQVVRVPAVEERLVEIRGRHQHLWRRGDGQDLQVAEVLAQLAARHDPHRGRVLAAFTGLPTDDNFLAVVANEADATDVLVFLVAVDDVLEEDGMYLRNVLDVCLGRFEEQWTSRGCGGREREREREKRGMERGGWKIREKREEGGMEGGGMESERDREKREEGEWRVGEWKMR